MKLCSVCLHSDSDHQVKSAAYTVRARDPEGELIYLEVCIRHQRAYKTLLTRQSAEARRSETYIAVALEDGRAPLMLRAQELS
jgi:hypothetical protein